MSDMPDKLQARRGGPVPPRNTGPSIPADLIDRTTAPTAPPADGDAAAVTDPLGIPSNETAAGGTDAIPNGESGSAGATPPAAPNVNGIDLRRCEFKSDKGRQCVLAPHDASTDHSFRSQTGSTVRDSKPVAEIPLDVLTESPMEDVPDDAPPVETVVRSDAQKLIDADVKAAHEAWVAAGKPKDFNDSPRKRRLINPEHVDGLRALLLEAGRFHGLKVKVAPPKTHESGKRMLYFVVMDKPGRNPAPATSATVTPPPVGQSAEDAAAARVVAEKIAAGGDIES